MQIISESPEQTREVAERLAGELKPGSVLAFFGDLAAGKTSFISGLAEGLGFQGEVTSPTFALVHEYVGGRLPLYHFDMYRVAGFEDLLSTGFFDYIDAGGVLAVEWSENIRSWLPERFIKVSIGRGSHDNQRIITIERDSV